MNTTVSSLMQALEAGHLNTTLSKLYGQETLPLSRKRVSGLLQKAQTCLNAGPVFMVCAPGRTELGGNHTDHNHGRVLAAAVHLDILAVVQATGDMTATIHSDGHPRPIAVNLTDTEPKAPERETSEGLVRGVADGLSRSGYAISGFTACITSSIPMGAGLSSSAAFGVLMGRIFNHLCNSGNISALDIARTARRAENLHFGKPCGFMDQIACSFEGVLGIDFFDPDMPIITPIDTMVLRNSDTPSQTPPYPPQGGTSEIQFRPVAQSVDNCLPPLPINTDSSKSDYVLCVMNTGGSHADLTPDYAAIPAEMHAAAAVLGKKSARGLSREQVLAALPELRHRVGERAILRLLHFIEEDERATLQATALQQNHTEQFLNLVQASGRSSTLLLQNCFSPATPKEQPIPLALTLTEHFLQGQGACRVHGGGFAGTIQAFVPRDRFEAYQTLMEHLFGTGAVAPLSIRQAGHELLQADT